MKTKNLISIVTILALVLTLTTLIPTAAQSALSEQPANLSVEFDSNGGAAVPAITNIFPNAAILEPAQPTRAGCTFGGWFKDDDTFAEEFVFGASGTPVTADITLYAKWDALSAFTLSYNSNTTAGTGTAPAVVPCFDGEWVEVAGAGDLAFETFVFAGWNTQSDENGDDYSPGELIQITANTTLYALWIPEFFEIPVTDIEIDDSDFGLSVGQTQDLTVTFTPDNATNRGVTWSSSDTTVATVLGGRVTAVGTGAATITVTSVDGGFTDTVTVTVTAAFVPVNQITGIDTTPFIEGTSRILGWAVYPATATNQEISWSIVDTPGGTTAPGAAVGESDGIVTATGAGTFVVRATIAAGLNAADFTQDFTIEIIPEPEPIPTSLPDITPAIAAVIAFLAISAVAWAYLINTKTRKKS